MAEIIAPDVQIIQSLTPEQAWHYRIFPKNMDEQVCEYYIDETVETDEAEMELEMLFGKQIRFEKVSVDDMQKALATHYRKEKKDKRVENLEYKGDSASFIENLIREAKGLGSSDIHIEIYDQQCRVRLRIDGMLVERYKMDKHEYPSFINQIKIMSNLDISEKRLPQDGRIFFRKQNENFDIRVSVLPTLHGEKVVLRILSNDATNIDINALGFSDFDLNNYLEGIKKPYGILLISGPTGSGKTTTLYATLKLLNQTTKNVLTIEDPIEYTLEGINQVQLKESIGLDFASALRTFLRQDPDVIMLGEIRDGDTAAMAVRAALTGHLVLSTIHTNNAWGTVSRLIDMGVPPFLLANTLNTSVAQRLVRLLCNECKQETKFEAHLFPKNFQPPRPVHCHYKATGCDSCFYTGYKGRKAVYEVIPIDREFSEKIKTNDHEVNEQLNEKQIKTLSENAFELFEQGMTSLEEVYPMLMNF